MTLTVCNVVIYFSLHNVYETVSIKSLFTYKIQKTTYTEDHLL